MAKAGRETLPESGAMKFLDLTFPEPAENLACDEALLDWCRSSGADEILRVWEPRQTFVVLGQSNRFRREVRVDHSEVRGVPIMRRCSGGGTVLQTPGCFNYALVLRVSDRPELKTVSGANQSIMEKHRGMLQALLRKPVHVQGHTDLAVASNSAATSEAASPLCKVSGNAQRRTRNHLLFHGTFLLNLDLEMVEQFLAMPSKEPAYRSRRSHAEFLLNLHLPRSRIAEGLRRIWNASETFQEVDGLNICKLAQERYVSPEWNFRY